MVFRRLPLGIRVFGLLVASLLVVQILNLAAVLLFPPTPGPVFTVSDIKAALDKVTHIDNLQVWTKGPEEMRPQKSQLRDLRDSLAARLGVAPDDLIVEFATSPSRTGTKTDKGVLDAATWLPEDAPQDGQFDPDSFIFSRHFKIGRRMEDGSWRVVSPVDSLKALWKDRAMIWLLGTVLLSVPLAYLLASWIAAPIRRFGAAAERLGRNLREPPLRLDGPAEIAGAAKAFNEMASRLNRFVDDRVAMMGAVAHDLRTPLTRLSFRLDTVAEDVRAKAEDDIGEMREMLAALLSFVQTMQNDRPRQELRSLITSIADDQADMGRNVVVEDGPEIVLVGDHLGLRSLFTNLIDNAVAYGGGASIRLRQQGREVIVEVDDDGPGLPQEELERVFEPFYRSEPSRSRSTGGMGLGLALVRSVAIAHGGRALLENRVDRGLRASVHLPV
ncbi:ATP-binding protein [Inquilinus sp. CA228]|uniref:ATP-binding protein n=1 Tax=Inquilinus sp. CA228 TaxID=3455609 RepID=UPI003F8D1EE3